ncbi:hypothetical protein LEN26_006812 [Aphanomyces euteiches]|nr:hypothetical protein AeMF1_020731 [Aphanomyces euteiches]KAH9134457.1 hypothetical protein LEN26_006812 [Aphanomyces euteiches]KAH9193196.1 hypothetical protein AeNC1_004834 [Aphanomyces euteiches]
MAPLPPQTQRLWLVFAGVMLVVIVLFGQTLYEFIVKVFFGVLCLVAITAVTNPSDASFAEWISKHGASPTLDKSSAFGWFRSIVGSLTLPKDEWIRYNAIVFTLVFVPATEQHAIGILGNWMWCDSSYALSWFCRQYGSTIASLVHGEKFSRTESESIASLELASKSKATQAEVQRQYATAADHYVDAAFHASQATKSNRLTANYKLMAARCLLQSMLNARQDTSAIHRRAEELFRASCEAHIDCATLSDTGQCLVELAKSYKVLDKHDESDEVDATLSHQSALFLEAMEVFEAGDHQKAALDAGLMAGSVYATHGIASTSSSRIQWLTTAARSYQVLSTRSKEAQLASICCYLALADVEGARQVASRPFDPHDILLNGIFEAYERWNAQHLEDAISAYEQREKVLEPWMKRALEEWKEVIERGDLT